MARDRWMGVIVGCGVALAGGACDRGAILFAPQSDFVAGPAADATVQAGHKTFFELRCRRGHDGTGIYSVTRNGETIGTLRLDCKSGEAVAGMIVTKAQPNDWEMQLTVVRLSDGRSKTCRFAGTEFPATRSCSPSPLGITSSVTVPRPLP